MTKHLQKLNNYSKKATKIFCILFYLLSVNTNGQDFNPQILVLPESPSLQDFDFLKEELKNAQIVLLGEKTHFDGNVFEVKTEIIKYLHQELGYNTIAFESGVYDVYKANQSISKGESVRTAFEKSLFPIWSKTKEFQSFVTFFDRNKKNLKVIGFDNQITGDYGENELVKDLYQYCSQNQLSLKLKSDDLELLIESITNSGVFDEGDIAYEKYKSELNKLLKNIDKKPKEEIHFYWKQIIKNLLSIGEESYSPKETILSSFNTTSDDNFRDKQMADNLISYLKSYPNEKIICWGANAHFVNDMASINDSVINKFVPMGSHIKRELQEKVYSLALISASDSIFLNKVWSATPIKKNSFEQFLKNQEKAHLFISSNQDEMKKIQLNRLFSPITFIESRLDQLHDGYLYFDQVRQSSIITNEENENKSISSEDKTTSNLNLENYNEVESKLVENAHNLEEVLIVSYSKKFSYSIINKAIQNINKNYPVDPFNATQHSNINVKVQNETALDLNFITNQYDRGYNQIDRNSKRLKQVQWNFKGDYSPKNIREFWSLSYNNPLMYGPYFNIRKSKKFVFKIVEIKIYNKKQVFVIDFSINRNHFTYTKRNIPSAYSGTIFINKDDYAIVKVIENWDFLENTETSKYEMNGWIDKYTKKEIDNERVETNFNKRNGLYFLTDSEIELTGKLYDKEQNIFALKVTIDSKWIDFNSKNPSKINYKDELNLFESIEFNKSFWDNYKLFN